MDSIARDLQGHRQQAPQAPTLRRYKSNDTTVEKLGELLRDNPAGLLVLRDELVGLIASWDREGREGERAFYLEAWNGNASFDTDRIGRGSIFIPNLCVSIFGGIQPDKLTGYLEQAANALANDGMLQRFQVLVYPDHRPWEWRDRIPDKDARDQAFAMFDALAEFDPEAWGAAPADDFARFPNFRFDEAAQEIFIEWSGDLRRTKLPGEDQVQPRSLFTRIDQPPEAGIQDVFRHLANDHARTDAIAVEVRDAYRQGRKVLVLTERTEHLDAILAALNGQVPVPFVLHGRMSKKQRATTITERDELPPEAPRILLATGKLVGEGFDHPALDTLVLAMPISWKGTLQQYAGRLHREHVTKTDVRIIDFVDTGHPALLRMCDKRQRGYRAMGYRVVENPQEAADLLTGPNTKAISATSTTPETRERR